MPRPVQQPRVPIWVAGMWPNRRPMRRAARYEGAMPIFLDEAGEFAAPQPETVVEVSRYIAEHRRTDEPFHLSVTAMSLNADAQSDLDIAAFAEAGATWWFEQWHPGDLDHDLWMERVLAGPPAL